ncbi:hypothetical protein GWI33_011984 [Rhynchophorus ferrugineus]|uniref:Uncharacterized protein n=1 Tax=Rhynchophorus ferrugineus TaxID=354439 RepID=A0A834MIL9_RHYFE|nr:hypothetical protein GWI33_011984 [Rhynchophorus ferrugineus]
MIKNVRFEAFGSWPRHKSKRRPSPSPASFPLIFKPPFLSDRKTMRRDIGRRFLGGGWEPVRERYSEDVDSAARSHKSPMTPKKPALLIIQCTGCVPCSPLPPFGDQQGTERPEKKIPPCLVHIRDLSIDYGNAVEIPLKHGNISRPESHDHLI